MKRLVDIVFSAVGLFLLAPLFVWVALWIKLDSPGPVFFRQDRVGMREELFRIFKFRTMRTESEGHGLLITVGVDSRVTRAGKFLRKYKIDELPQLLDVFLGNMSLVGPRPEVPSYVSFYPAGTREVIFSVRPGITDMASILFRDESDVLSKAADAHKVYIDVIIPKKVELYLDYVANHSLVGDFTILLHTVVAILRPR